MLTQLDEKYYRDITAIRKSLDELNDTLRKQTRAKIATAVMLKLLDPKSIGDEVHRAGVARISVKMADDLINELNNNG